MALLNCGNLVDAALMTPAFKFGVEKNVDQFTGKPCPDNAAAHAKDVGVIMKARIFCAEIIGTAGGANAVDFVCRHRNPDAGAAAENPEAPFVGKEFFASRLRNRRVID